jgi:DNA-binding CsgD family transcriptional regulator
MTVVSHTSATTRVLVAGDDSTVRNAIVRLLSLDEALTVVEDATEADVVVNDALLAELADVPIGDFLATIRSLPFTPAVLPVRHLQPVAGKRDIRALLSERELQVVKLVAEGLSNKQISLRLRLSDKTVKNHISHILAKMGLSARTQVAVHAIRAGLV